MHIRRAIGVFLLVISVSLAAPSVFGNFSMAGVHAGLVIFGGLGGLILIIK